MSTYLYVVNVIVDDEKSNIVPLTTILAKNEAEVHNVGIAAALKVDHEIDVRALEVLVCNPFQS